VKAAQRREVAKWLISAFGISVRRARRLVMIQSSSFYYRPHVRDHTALSLRLRDLAHSRPSYGYRRLFVLIRRDGPVVNHKLVHKLYKAQNLELRLRKRRNRTRMERAARLKAEAPNQRWSMDLMADRLENGRRFRLLTLVDHFSRVSPALVAGTSITGRHVVEILDRIPKDKLPRFIQVDNGPEFVSRTLEAWAYRNGVVLDFSRPGKPTDNAPIEAFNARLREEFLNPNLFTSLEEAQFKLEAFRLDYNTFRPHSALGYLTPAKAEKRFYTT